MKVDEEGIPGRSGRPPLGGLTWWSGWARGRASWQAWMVLGVVLSAPVVSAARASAGGGMGNAIVPHRLPAGTPTVTGRPLLDGASLAFAAGLVPAAPF